jgi:(p)ppGpp synthase/HD superfamily hydrolase
MAYDLETIGKMTDAEQFATVCHIGQLRKWTREPYINHPRRVASRVATLPGATEPMICAAWLHDVCEDCDVNSQVILDRFGLATADLVVQLTAPSKAYSHLPRSDRKEIDREYLAKVPPAAKRIKAIDRIDNLRDMKAAPADFQRLYANESRLLLEVLRDGIEPELASELSAALASLP